MILQTPWDDVAEKFNTFKEDVYHGAIDNVETVWPIILDFIKNTISNSHGLKALDFGCGTGMFCRELKSLGFESFGIDVSSEMIKIGKKHLSKDIKLYVGDTDFAKKIAQNEGKFDLITSIMVLQFITDNNIKDIVEAVKLNGYFIFVIHNPPHLKDRGFKDTFTFSDTNITIPLYQRSIESYDAILLPLGFKRIFQTYTTESQEFLKKYNINRTSLHPKYIILAYKLSPGV